MPKQDAASGASRRIPSLIFRQSIASVLIVVLALGLIGLVIDQAFRSTEQAALWERLESNLFVVLAGIEVDQNGQLQWAATPLDSRLMQPGSGLYAGGITQADRWFSASTINASIDPLETLSMMERGDSRRIQPSSALPFYRYQMGLGWETQGGEIIDLTLWVAEDEARSSETGNAFRANLGRWLLIAGIVILSAQLVLLLVPLQAFRKVATEVQNMESGKQQRLQGRYPRELKPLTDNLNALMETERANTEQYQRALADLAHALKTPLAVIQAQLDDLPAHDAESLRDTVVQMQHHIRHELDRAARSGRRTMLASIDVGPVTLRVITSLQKLYPEHRFELDCTTELSANILERDLIEVLGNLLENSAKYGANITRIQLQPAVSGGRRTGLQIDVDDDGPGLTQAEFEYLLQRGIRGDQRAEGQGLGLAIVERIARSYQGSITTQPARLGGTSIRVTLLPE